jgi:hypothetical protein
LDLLHVLGVVSFLPQNGQLLFEAFDTLNRRNVSILHVIGLFNKVDESLRLNESVPKFLVVFRPRVFFEVENFVSRCFFAQNWLLEIEVVEVIDEVEQKVEEKLLDPQVKLAKLQVVVLTLVLPVFVYFPHVIFQFLHHKSDIWLRLGW